MSISAAVEALGALGKMLRSKLDLLSVCGSRSPGHCVVISAWEHNRNNYNVHCKNKHQ